MLLGMRKNVIAALVVFASASTLCCQTRDSEDQIKAKCEKYLQTPLPAEATAIATPKTWPECNSYKLYSGIGTKVDFAAARKCAWAERLSDQAGANVDRYSIASYLGGSAMLTVLYANGEGVPQNIPLAGRFACEAEIGHGLKDIEAISSSPIQTRRKFKFCDEAYSTPEMNLCMTFDSEVAGTKSAAMLWRNYLPDGPKHTKRLSSPWNKRWRRLLRRMDREKRTWAEQYEPCGPSVSWSEFAINFWLLFRVLKAVIFRVVLRTISLR